MRGHSPKSNVQEQFTKIRNGLYIAAGVCGSFAETPQNQSATLRLALVETTRGIEDYYEQLNRCHPKGTFAKGDDIAIQSLSTLEGDLRRDICAPLDFAKASGTLPSFACLGGIAINLQDKVIHTLNDLHRRINAASHSNEQPSSMKKLFRHSSKEKKSLSSSRTSSIGSVNVKHSSLEEVEEQQHAYPKLSALTQQEAWDQLTGEPVHRIVPYSAQKEHVDEGSWDYSLHSSSVNTQFVNIVQEPEDVSEYSIVSDPRSASEVWGICTNPFITEVPDIMKAKSPVPVLPQSRPSDEAMIPPPLRPRAPQRQARKEYQRGSQSSATSEELMTPTSAPEMTYALPVYYNDYSVRGMDFPAPPRRTTPPSEVASVATSVPLRQITPPSEIASAPTPVPRRQSTSSWETASAVIPFSPRPANPTLERLARLAKPEPNAMPRGVVRTSLRRQQYGMPALPSYPHTNQKSEVLTMKIDGPVGYVPPQFTIPTDLPNLSFDPKNIDKRAAFCKGAFKLQDGLTAKAYSVHRRPGAMWGPKTTTAFHQCKDCNFEGKAIEYKNEKGKDQVRIDTDVYGSDGILYRWEFLFLCHLPVKNVGRHPVDSPFGCPFCVVEGEGMPVYGGVACFLNHLQTHRQSQPAHRPNADMVKRMHAIVDRSPAIEESFAIALPPIYI